MPAFQATPASRSSSSSARAGLRLLLERAAAGRPEAGRPTSSPRSEVRDQVAVLGRRAGRPGRRASRADPRCRTRRSPGPRRPAQDVAVDVPRASDRCGVGRQDQHHLVVGPVDGEVARAIAAAVFRPIGSSRTRAVGHLVADQPLVAAVGDDRDVVGQSASRRAVAWSSDSPPSSGRNGFGRSGRLRGWSRVPPPPAMITAYMRRPF